MFSQHDLSRDACQLYGEQAKNGYDWWWHSFTAIDDQTGEEKPFYIEYFLCNPDEAKDHPVFGQLPENLEKGVKPSYLMVNVGTWGKDHRQLHRFFSWYDINVDYGVPYKVEAADCLASETRLKGSVCVRAEEAKAHPEWMSDAGTMEWDLMVNKIIPFNVGYGADEAMRSMQLFEMFWHAEGMKTEYSGKVILDGRRYTVHPRTCYGYADKNWGKDFTTPWLWLSSNDLVSEITGKRLRSSVFDIGGGRPKVGPVALKGKLLAAFWYEGTGYEFNFSKVWTGVKTKFNCYETDELVIWHVEQENLHDRMITDVTCRKEDMLLIQYEAPDGAKRHNRLWNGGNGTGTIQLFHEGKLVDRIRAGHIGCEYGEYDAMGPYENKEREG